MLRTIPPSVFASARRPRLRRQRREGPHPNASRERSSPGGGSSRRQQQSADQRQGATCDAVPLATRATARRRRMARVSGRRRRVLLLAQRMRHDDSGARTRTRSARGIRSAIPARRRCRAALPVRTARRTRSCGVTIYCIGVRRPGADLRSGDTQVSSQSDCLQDDAKCYSRTTCNFTIWCTGPRDQSPTRCRRRAPGT